MDSNLKNLLSQYDQSQVLNFWEQLSADQQRGLESQIQSIDFEELKGLINQAFHKSESSINPDSISPLQNSICLPENEKDREKWAHARERGHKILDAGKVAAVLVAGGQGSRLGFDHPKGMFPIGPVTDRTLFQIFFEQLLALSNRHGVRIPYFIMTSDATHEETESFLQEHSWFGYPQEDVFLFKQGTMPAVDDKTGKILLKDPSTIAMSPDGHGGMLKAMQRANLFEEMQKRGIDYLFYHQVDNPCVSMCDPAMFGFHEEQGAEISTKVVAKREPGEKVGVLAEFDGKQSIIEYSDLLEEMAQDYDETGRLKYWAGNIAIHIMNRSLLEQLATGDSRLPVHVAHKKVPFVDDAGQQHSPDEPNAYKFERFIFDAIPRAKNPLVIETSREEEFNPVKNAEGNDSPASSQAALLARAHRWMRIARYNCDENAKIEISPLIALEPHDLENQFTDSELAGAKIVLSPNSGDDEK
ncbi:UDPGP type 1 family protein [Rubinisphaera sp.]|uniref:UDPGP type 1 family protein n=1 Tax=Rubinisphaera sp. TaxID=2024857 RepID=UPI000C0D58E1|nr:UDPGP type 1 family protein [Rubinisphaera sp.]MBV07635.1 UDP-N-acetylglucosamine pyrophosphorylase [Rubinisphaera sp.]HCS51346.1 UDP-N-acetylglucosamine pyrophosphorylase [Planctomycetaceae bacterium]|tara:strand:- start:81 stop:1496 length:1416 start_codon:yes stop_codon:yes gene_type:complete